jgi:hypothetical protein
MFKLPSGERIMPELDSETLLALGVKRFKLVQTTADEIEFRFIGMTADLVVDQAVIQDMVSREISPLFKVKQLRVTEFANAPSGKFLWHERLID